MIIMNDYDTKNTFNAWVIYQGIYAHFTRKYDYFLYNGKGNWNSIDSMQRSFAKHEKNGNFSMQRKIFKDLGKAFKNKEDLIFFYLSQFTDGIKYPSHFDTDIYEEYKARMNNFDFHIEQDIEKILKYMSEKGKTFDELFVTNTMNHPCILKLSLAKIISLETFSILDMLLNFIPDWDKYLKDPIWKDHKSLVINYKPFLEVDTNKYRKMLLNILKKG